MSYSKKNVELAFEELTKKRLKNHKEQENRLKEAYAKSSELEALDKTLSLTGLKIMSCALQGKDGLEERMEALRLENVRLQKRREEILLSLGYSRDYTDLRYDCPLCQDTGYVMEKMCSCLKSSLVEKELSTSGIGSLLKSQGFDTFSLDYYQGDAREQMEIVLSFLKEYVEDFGKDGEIKNLLFLGGTGLGKTHLSTAIAKSLIEKGVSVVYETSQNIFSDFESQRFNYFNQGEDLTEKYFTCDLLIIDDLGTEAVNNFTVSCLYNILNTRLNRGMPVILSTNLTSSELRKTYNDRITSRLLGEFSLVRFCGSDIRVKK